MPRAGAASLVAILAASLLLASCALVRRGDGSDHSAPIDLNRASLRKVERLPGVTPSMARHIVDGRPYTSPRDLVTRGILTERELERVADGVTIEDGGH